LLILSPLSFTFQKTITISELRDGKEVVFSGRYTSCRRADRMTTAVLLRRKGLELAPSGGSRQRNLMPAMEAKRTVGGRGRHSRA
jgi:hypothetical protein